ncbi:MAG TPA: cyclic nucleotide-binding domain-containing protein [Acidimicrobiales bacterium]
MRIERSVTTLSWIPSESTTGLLDLPMKTRIGRFDPPPPAAIGRPADEVVERLVATGLCRFANQLQAWIVVDDGQIVDAGYSGRGHLGSTTISLGLGDVTVAAVALPEIQRPPQFGATWVRFSQTVGGRTGWPLPRPVKRAPFIRYHAPIVWTTLELTIHVDGRHEGKLVGASSFPRHWLYDDAGELVAKSGLTEPKKWMGNAFGVRTPWGEHDSPALLTAVESAIERELSTAIMRYGRKPRVVRFDEGDTIIAQGTPGDGLHLLLDGVVAVEVDGQTVAEVGPGAVLGERAVLEDGVRTSTLRSLTRCRTVHVPADAIDRERLAPLAAEHRREDSPVR